MRGELDLVRMDVQLFEQFAGVAVAEDGVRGKVVGGVHEVGGCCRGFACAGDAGFGVADDAAVEIGELGAEDGREREDDRRGVTAGVGDEARVADRRSVQLGRAVDGFGLGFVGGRGVGVLELVDGAVGRVVADARRRKGR